MIDRSSFSLRKLGSVEEGIRVYDEYPPSAGFIRFVEYQPGNGTRYVLVITELSSLKVEAGLSIGVDMSKPVYLVTKVEGRPGVMVVGSGFLHYSYVQEKFSCSTSDAVVLAELIGYLLNKKYISCDEFLAQGK